MDERINIDLDNILSNYLGKFSRFLTTNPTETEVYNEVSSLSYNLGEDLIKTYESFGIKGENILELKKVFYEEQIKFINYQLNFTEETNSLIEKYFLKRNQNEHLK